MNILKKLLEIKIFHTSNFPMDYRGKKEKNLLWLMSVKVKCLRSIESDVM